GMVLRDTNLSVNVSGTWPAARGEIQLQAQQIQFRKSAKRIPTLEALRLAVQLDRQQARVAECQLLVQGQPVTLTGEIPLGENFWARLGERKYPDWENASARLQIEEAQIAAFEPLFPNLFAREGEFNLDVSLLPGCKPEGVLT